MGETYRGLEGFELLFFLLTILFYLLSSLCPSLLEFLDSIYSEHSKPKVSMIGSLSK